MSQLQLFVAEIGKICKRISKKAVTPTYNIIKPSISRYYIEKGSCAYFPFRNFEEYVIMDLDYREIGRNIRYYRLKKGMNQRELAERVHVSDQHISHIENAHTKLGLPTLVAIANALETDCNSLLGDTLTGSRKVILNRKLMTQIERMDSTKFGLLIRSCLKIGNMPNGESFFRQTRRFDAAILCVLQGKSTQYGGKRTAVWAY